MPFNTTHTGTPAGSPVTPRRFEPRARGPLAKPCRTCGDLHPVGALQFGQCPDCAGLIALPLRGPGGRFISLTHPTASSTDLAGGVR